MDWTQILTAFLSCASAVLVAYLGKGIKKSNSDSNAQVIDEVNSLKKDVTELKSGFIGMRKDLDDNNLRTLRLDLLHAIETDPDNVLVIIEMAQRYFVGMNGNCYMSRIFQDWASEHNVPVSWLFNKG